MKVIRTATLFVAVIVLLVLAGMSDAAGKPAITIDSRYTADQQNTITQSSGIPKGYGGRLTIRNAAGSRLESPQDRFSLLERQAHMFKVLAALEKRIDDSELLDKVRHKLPELSEKRLNMIASLSDRMEGSSKEPGHNVAFLLIATLIIFS